MKLRCTRPFGNFTPGDEIDVPDGAVFDGAFFEEAELKPVVPETPAKEDE